MSVEDLVSLTDGPKNSEDVLTNLKQFSVKTRLDFEIFKKVSDGWLNKMPLANCVTVSVMWYHCRFILTLVLSPVRDVCLFGV